MKILSGVFTAFLFLILSGISFSQTPTYNLYANNLHRWTPDSLTFDIRVLHTNADPFIYAIGQYHFRFNPAIANGGTLTYRIVASELPDGFWPQNPQISGTELRLAGNFPNMSGAPMISSSAPGTLIARMSIRTTSSSFAPAEPINLKWRNSDDPPLFTKLSAFIGSKITNITNSANHFVDTTTVSINQISTIIPGEYKIFQNYPNPFNPITKIRIDIPKFSNVKLIVYDVAGREIEKLINAELEPGSYEYNWSAAKYSSGIYFYRILSGDFAETKRMILVK